MFIRNKYLQKTSKTIILENYLIQTLTKQNKKLAPKSQCY